MMQSNSYLVDLSVLLGLLRLVLHVHRYLRLYQVILGNHVLLFHLDVQWVHVVQVDPEILVVLRYLNSNKPSFNLKDPIISF